MKSDNKLLRISIELYGWIFLIGLLAGIWVPNYRWRLISTSIIFLISACLNHAVLRYREKNSNNQKGGAIHGKKV